MEVTVADDGAGIDSATVRAAALKAEAILPETAEQLSHEDALGLVFQSGVTMNPMITDISGRGLGLAIVRERVERLGGQVGFETHPGVGTTFRMHLPLTLATFRGITVRVGDQVFVLPTQGVERALRVDGDSIRTVENRATLRIGNSVLSLVRLADVLETPVHDSTQVENSKMVVGSGDKRMALLVNEVIGEQEVLVKSLGRQLSRVRNIAGAAVLGSGRVAPILNVPDLLKSAARVSGSSTVTREADQAPAKRRSVLVAEASITARTLLKSILEAAGYSVRAAVDGLEALTPLRSEEFDLVVSDVDMPRLGGFDLTTKIRADKKLGELPVILVTALTSPQDVIHGLECGADTFIRKPYEPKYLLQRRRYILILQR